MKPAIFFFIASVALAAGAQSHLKQFAVVSDIHFNPLADPALVTQLQAAEPSQWEAIFSSHPKSAIQKYGEDAAWPLLAALVSGLQDVKPRLIIVTGDILPHKFPDKFAAAAHTKDLAALRSFVKKTVLFVTLQLQKASQGVPVVYTLGNNDQECGDYALQPDGPFLSDVADAVQTLAKVDETYFKTWLGTGSYVARNPMAGRHRIISLNTNFWARRYMNSCGDKTSDPGAAVMTWLSNQLLDAKRHSDKVWLVYHIPPGIDGHSSSVAKEVVPMWKHKYSDGFSKLLDQYRKTIELSLSGHTHLDDIRLVKTEHGTSLVLLCPGVSPNVGQNPAFRVITTYSRARVNDLLTYYMPKLDELKWQLEYSARQAYGLKKIDARSYEALYQSIDDLPAMRDKWRLFYSVSRPVAVNDSKTYTRSIYCATGNISEDAFKACLKSAAP